MGGVEVELGGVGRGEKRILHRNPDLRGQRRPGCPVQGLWGCWPRQGPAPPHWEEGARPGWGSELWARECWQHKGRRDRGAGPSGSPKELAWDKSASLRRAEEWACLPRWNGFLKACARVSTLGPQPLVRVHLRWAVGTQAPSGLGTLAVPERGTSSSCKGETEAQSLIQGHRAGQQTLG